MLLSTHGGFSDTPRASSYSLARIFHRFISSDPTFLPRLAPSLAEAALRCIRSAASDRSVSAPLCSCSGAPHPACRRELADRRDNKKPESLKAAVSGSLHKLGPSSGLGLLSLRRLLSLTQRVRLSGVWPPGTSLRPLHGPSRLASSTIPKPEPACQPHHNQTASHEVSWLALARWFWGTAPSGRLRPDGCAWVVLRRRCCH